MKRLEATGLTTDRFLGSGSGIDLHVALDRRQVGRSLETALRAAIRSGHLPSGTALPSSRTLSADLGVARNTVVDVYEQLIAEGWLIARPGSKTRVADRAASPLRRPGPQRLPTLRPPSLPLDLRPGSPDVGAFPRREWLAASGRALRSAPPEAFAYGDPRGLPQLREQLAAYLVRARGVETSATQIVVCLGISQALALAAKVLRARGNSRWAVEQYGLQQSLDIATDAGFSVEYLAVDRDGADVADLTTANVAYLTPAHQFPIGVPLSTERRRAVVRWARDGDRLVIEDDYDGEYRYDRQPVGALQALDPESVVYLGTTSKSLAPALRLGWMVVPTDLVTDLAQARTLAFGYNSSLDQLTLAELLRSGEYDRLLRRRRALYRRRRALLVEALQIPGVSVGGAAAGLHALVELGPGADEAELVDRAAKRGLAIEGLSRYSMAASPRRGLVIGFGAAAEERYEQCLAVLADVLATASE